MSRRPTGRRQTKMISIRLDDELDADLIAWLEAHPGGRRSEAIRDLLRAGLRERDLRIELVILMREAVTEALANLPVAWTGRSPGAIPGSEIEEAFGEQLDQLLSRF